MSNNTLSAQKPKFSMVIRSDTYQKLIKQTLGNPKKAERYTAAILSAVGPNPELQKCEAKTILTGSLLAESLNLAHSPQLGQYYLVPFRVKAKYDKDLKKEIPEHFDAQFILGYKGYIQLAIRSGNYKKINVMEIKEGELVSYNPFDEDIVLKPIQDVDEREKTPTIGYYAMFEYVNGFKKVLYWSKKQMLSHADRYSPAFKESEYERLLNGEIPEKDMWRYSSFWYKDFDSMAKKTLIRQLIGKWGVMSAEMSQAIDTDNRIVDIENGGFTAIEPEEDEQQDLINNMEINTETGEVTEVSFNEI